MLWYFGQENKSLFTTPIHCDEDLTLTLVAVHLEEWFKVQLCLCLNSCLLEFSNLIKNVESTNCLQMWLPCHLHPSCWNCVWLELAQVCMLSGLLQIHVYNFPVVSGQQSFLRVVHHFLLILSFNLFSDDLWALPESNVLLMSHLWMNTSWSSVF